MKRIYEKPVMAVNMFDNADGTNAGTASSIGNDTTKAATNSMTSVSFGDFK